MNKNNLASFFAVLVAALTVIMSSGCGRKADVRDVWPVTIDGGAWPSSSHVQGIAVDKKNGFIYWSYATQLVKTNLEGEVLGSVTGILGHLGCLAFNEGDGKVYASLEYSDDDIHAGIMRIMKSDRKFDVAFFVAIFDGDKIDTVGMDVTESGVMEAVLLPKVVDDYTAEVDGKRHRWGCSGIDGVTFGPEFGKTDGEKFLTVAYGIYRDTTRTDNDDQILHQYSMDSVRKYKKIFSQDDMPQEGPLPDREYFIRTGNTHHGVQNLCWDPSSGNWLMFVYRGTKPQYPNGTLYIADGRKAPVPAEGMEGAYRVPLLKKGEYHAPSGIHYWESRLGDKGTAALGDGYFYMAESGNKSGLNTAKIHLMRWTGKTPDPFEEVLPKDTPLETQIDSVMYNHATDWMRDAKIGAFMHFLFWPEDRDLVNKFDVDALVGQLSDAGVGYFVITLGQNTGAFCAPNPVYDSISGYKAGERTALRDLPKELALKLREKGIRLMLYLPCQTPNRDEQAVRSFGFEDDKGPDREITVEGDYDRFISDEGLANWAKVIAWWSEHYGDLVSGWWLDGGYEWCGFNDEKAKVYAHAVKDHNPGAVVTFNPGWGFRRWTCAADYTAGEYPWPFDYPVQVTGRWKDGCQVHFWVPLSNGDICYYKDEDIIEWIKPIVANGGVLSLDVGSNFNPDVRPVGTMSPAMQSQLKKIVAAVNAD
ncbi:MAG: alpha-L-fucosidase [Bacteroidales bacterium]|nr:alpha-L-fucosidase [Bacteroidales bacterium]